MSMPRVAIATPVFNGGKYLAETMECVQALDYPHLVHVVHDNASTDETPRIIESYQGRKVPVLAIRAERTSPMAENWNNAVRSIPGDVEYFWLLCADDVLAPHAIRRLVAIAEQDPQIHLVGCQWRAHGLCGQELPKEHSVFAGTDILRRYFRRETMALSGMNVLFRRSLVESGTEFYDTTISSFDTDANIRACLRGKYGFVHEELLYWRQHDDSTTRLKSSRDMAFESEWLMLLDRYFSSALGFNEFVHCRKVFRYHLLRRLFKLSMRPGGAEVARRHLEILRAHGNGVTPMDIPLAILDWLAYAIRGHRARVGLPRRGFAGMGSGLAAVEARY